ncbi:MAG: malate dehydrogenase [Gammaproteobacteria bacterium]|nr:MAG: malate dehydrogenase [Gammaproteobacteria bacterium]
MSKQRRKTISVIGAGNVGEHVASLALLKGLGDVRLFDIPRKDGDKVFEPVKGKALDLQQMLSALEIDAKVEGFTVSPDGKSGYEALEGSDIVVITAGFPRRPGMSREDLLDKNIQILKAIVPNIQKYAPNSIVIVVTNPVDTMTYATYKLLGFPTKRVMGMAGILDSARFRTFISYKLGVSPKDVHAYVIGGHGDEMVPIISRSNVKGIPLKNLLTEEEIKEIVERTKFGGGEIVALMGTSAYYAPAMAVVEMIESILLDAKRIHPCSVYIEKNEFYEVEDICVGLPVLLGKDGWEKVIEVPISEEERQQWRKSVESVKRTIEMAKKFL